MLLLNRRNSATAHQPGTAEWMKAAACAGSWYVCRDEYEQRYTPVSTTPNPSGGLSTGSVAEIESPPLLSAVPRFGGEAALLLFSIYI